MKLFILIAIMKVGPFTGEVHVHDTFPTAQACDAAVPALYHAYYQSLARVECHAFTLPSDN